MNWWKIIRITIIQAVTTFVLATFFIAILDRGEVDWPAQFRTGTAMLLAFLIFNYFDARKSQRTDSN